MKKALIVWGGWQGHQPRECAELCRDLLAGDGFDVELSESLDRFAEADALQAFDLIIPMWTMGQLTGDQERGLLAAVREGVGIAGLHGGMGDAFRSNTSYQFMVGGQFVAHPGGQVEYTVNIVAPEDPLVAGLSDFKVKSEQYYMHVDPTNRVLATTTFHVPDMPWVDGCVMPVVWTRQWGKGRVFYSSLGHVAAEFELPEMREIQRRGMVWASR